MFTPSRRAVTLICLWVSFAGGFFLWRSSTFLVWCDTSLIATNLFEESKRLIWSDSSILKSIIHDSFYDVGSEGYRPLSRTILWAGVAFFSDSRTDPNIWFAAVGAVFGFAAVASFLVARRFLQSDGAALLAVLLFLFSTPVVTGAWNVFCGIQAIVPLLICAGLLLYWKAVEMPPSKWPYLAGLCVLLFFGPWFREFVGLLPLLIVFLEVQRARRPTILMGLAGLFFLHALYPAVVPKLLFYPDLPLKPVFEMGHLGAQIQGGVSKDQESASVFSHLISNVKWEVPLHFLTLYPPVLLALVLLGVLLRSIRGLWIFIDRRLNPVGASKFIDGSHSLKREIFISSCFLFGASGSLLAYYYEPSSRFWFSGVPLGVCLAFGLLSLYRDLFLGWWFYLFFLPFLRVFTEQVHLAYSLLPATIIILAILEDCWRSLKHSRGFFEIIRYSFVFLAVVAVADHALNPYNSYRVVKSVNDGIVKMANWFRSNVPEGSIVITNALHGEDIRLFSDGHIKILWTVRAGIARNEDAVADPKELEKLLKRAQGKNQIYFLDMDFNYTPDKVAYHSHKYVRNQSVAMQKMALVHTTRVLYPYLDPLKAFVSRPYISFLGPPDLENDFYRGPAQDGTPFLREAYAEYHVYKVTGTNVDPWDPNGPSKTVKAGYRGFDILEINGRYFAIPTDEGPFDVRKAINKGYSKTYQSDGYEKLISEIERAEKGIASPNIPQ